MRAVLKPLISRISFIIASLFTFVNPLETTVFTTELINKDFTTNLNNLITTNILETTNLNEIIPTTNNPLLYEATIPKYFDDKIIETEINLPSSNIIKESSITNKDNYISETSEIDTNNILINTTTNRAQSSTESINYKNQTIKDITKIIYQSSEHIYKTNYIIIGNNEEVYQGVIDNIINNYDINKGEEMVFKGEDNFIFHITNSQNELELLKGNSNNTNKVSVIDLGECEHLLKKHYQNNENASLIIMKFEKLSNISSERSLQYEVYEPYHKTKLNLSICENITIDVYVPVILSEKMQNLFNELKDMGYDLFDINSPFYQDICTPYKSSDGTDVPLSDRINSFYNNDEITIYKM